MVAAAINVCGIFQSAHMVGLQIIQGRILGPEIVDGDFYPKALKLLQHIVLG